MVERRLDVIQNNKHVRFIERPEYKRRWNHELCETRTKRAIHNWLLSSLEKNCQTEGLQTCSQLADYARKDDIFQRIAALYTGIDTFDPNRENA